MTGLGKSQRDLRDFPFVSRCMMIGLASSRPRRFARAKQNAAVSDNQDTISDALELVRAKAPRCSAMLLYAVGK